MALINKAKLHQYIKLNYNVILSSEAGVGKTTVIKEVFDEAFGSNWRYFSCGTLDPWVDFVGLPKTVNRNGADVTELIRPEFWNTVEAIYLDEFNRAAPKVLNATLEILQF